MNKIISTLVLAPLVCYSQPENSNGNGPKDKDKDRPCNNPNQPGCDQTVPIEGIEWLIIGGILLGIKYFNKKYDKD